MPADKNYQYALACMKAEDRRRRQWVRDDLYPESHAAHIWLYRGTNCSVVRCDWFKEELELLEAIQKESGIPLALMINSTRQKIDNFQGYTRFPKRPVYERDFEGIIKYVPAPGGITYAQQYIDGSFVYGYDTSHIGQTSVKYKDLSWHILQVEFMVDAITIAKRLERRYRLGNRRQKLLVAREFNRRLSLLGKPIDLLDNHGLAMHLLFGEL